MIYAEKIILVLALFSITIAVSLFVIPVIYHHLQFPYTSVDKFKRRAHRFIIFGLFVYEEDKEMIPAEALEEGPQEKEQERQKQKLIGLISKTDILNVVTEREEFEKGVSGCYTFGLGGD